MENQLKVGQQFEVVEVLTEGGYGISVFKVGGHTLHFKEYKNGAGETLCNASGNIKPGINIEYGCHCLHMFSHEVKPVGRLTVTKVKNHETN